jgi:hypothetical protein
MSGEHATAERASVPADAAGRIGPDPMIPAHAVATRTSATKTCPSAPAEPGSVLLGIVVRPGEVAYLSPAIPATAEFLEQLTRSGIPIENRMRFPGTCMEHRCAQWKDGSGGGRCGLADRAIAALSISTGLENLPKCGIRSTWRWFAQHQAKACAACPEVIRRPTEP